MRNAERNPDNSYARPLLCSSGYSPMRFIAMLVSFDTEWVNDPAKSTFTSHALLGEFLLLAVG